jgi:hypothetical protein
MVLSVSLVPQTLTEIILIILPKNDKNLFSVIVNIYYNNYFVIFFLLGDMPASEFYLPTFRNTSIFISGVSPYTAYKDGTECPEMSAHKIQRPGHHPKERMQHSEHGESLKSRTIILM